MAKAGDKRRLENNAAKLRLLRIAISAALALHVAVRLLVFRASVTRWTLFGFAVSAVIDLACYRALAQIAVPAYSPSGDLLSGGGDLGLGGITAYYFDAIYLAIFVQITTVMSSKFWLVFLVIPAYALWQLWVGILQPYLKAPRQQEPVESQAEQARRERTEKRAQRRSQRYT